MNEPISMWSGAISCVQPRRLGWPWTIITFEPTPSIVAPIEISIRARSCTCGSEAALRITVGPRVKAAAISAFSVAITEGSSIRKSHGVSPRDGALRTMSVRPLSTCGAQRPERVQVRIEAPAADHVTAGRRHAGGPEAGQQRPGEQEGGANVLCQVGVDLGAVDR